MNRLYKGGKSAAPSLCFLEFIERSMAVDGIKWSAEKDGWVIPDETVDACRGIIRSVYKSFGLPDSVCELRLFVKYLCDDDELRSALAVMAEVKRNG